MSQATAIKCIIERVRVLATYPVNAIIVHSANTNFGRASFEVLVLFWPCDAQHLLALPCHS